MSFSVALRYDLSENIGTGHLKRLMYISAELKKRRISHHYVGTAELAQLTNEFEILHRQIVQVREDESELEWLQRSPKFSHVIVDVCHPHRNNAGELVRDLKQATSLKVAVIDSIPPDDFLALNDGIPDLIVTPHFNAEHYHPKPTTPNWLYGSRYSLLDYEYHQRRKNAKARKNNDDHHLLVCCGGSDPGHLTELISKQLVQQESLPFATTIIAGNMFSSKRKQKLRALVEGAKSNIKLMEGKNSIGEFLEQCTFLIGRDGLISEEAACLGKTSFLVMENTRYESYLRGFESSKLAKVFFLDQPEDKHLFGMFLQSLSIPEKVSEYSKFNQVAFDTVDGLGISRFLNAFLKI